MWLSVSVVAVYLGFYLAIVFVSLSIGDNATLQSCLPLPLLPAAPPAASDRLLPPTDPPLLPRCSLRPVLPGGTL